MKVLEFDSLKKLASAAARNVAIEFSADEKYVLWPLFFQGVCAAKEYFLPCKIKIGMRRIRSVFQSS